MGLVGPNRGLFPANSDLLGSRFRGKVSSNDEHPRPFRPRPAVTGRAPGSRRFQVRRDLPAPVATSGHRWGKDGEDATVAPLSRRAAQAPAQSLACFVSEWLPAVRPSLKPSTWDSYRSNLIHHVLPRLGEIPLTEIGPTDLNRLYVELLDSGRVDGTGGLSQKTVHYIHTIVHRTLRDAIRWGQLDRNAAELCDPPRQLHPEVTAWGEPEVSAFLAGTTGELYPLYPPRPHYGDAQGRAPRPLVGQRRCRLEAPVRAPQPHRRQLHGAAVVPKDEKVAPRHLARRRHARGARRPPRPPGPRARNLRPPP